MERTFSVTKVTQKIESTFDNFVKNFEAAIGRFIAPSDEAANADPEGTIEAIKAKAGMENMYMFPTGDPGQVLRLQGGTYRVKQFAWGNPLMAGNLIKMNIGVALYAPFRMIVFENDEKEVFVEYDKPSTYFSLFDEKVKTVGHGLDEKIEKLIAYSAQDLS
ncbi:DUF302 domain-containing protein [Mucilaginibacter celer]|uniref:DUF302 domain-containing protein n=1 Tax=Mucilaginibacter celer TaxID=2305508 RepID=A0A494VHR5_9SPHI|nr:DUF302 domain-containing protein [Mucilaginibacter celer]AYL94306.1 DUF302 domain-containing protein [Mucilaginibacter celer]